MKPAPYRLVFFLVALVVLGVFAAAVTIPNVFTAGDTILAEEVNANFATLAAAKKRWTRRSPRWPQRSKTSTGSTPTSPT